MRQNVALILRWACSREPSSEELARDCFVNQESLVSGWLHKVRGVVAYVQERQNELAQLGGIGIGVEIDEVCFRARWARGADGKWGKEWLRYIAAYERRSGKIILKQLPVRFAKNGGQGGGGGLTAAELHNFIFREDGSSILRVGSIVHTDGAHAYRDLDWRQEAEFPSSPSDELLESLTGQRPNPWRLENFREVLEREAAERRDFRGRSEEWASKYRHLKISHTSVSHTKKKGGVIRREFVAVRRVHLHPDVALILAGMDPWLVDEVTWRKAGTQTVDGHWTTLRRCGTHRGINTKLRAALHNAVLVHQWSSNAGPGADMFAHFSETLKQYRQFRADDIHACQNARAGDFSGSVTRGLDFLLQQSRELAVSRSKKRKARDAAQAFSEGAKSRASAQAVAVAVPVAVPVPAAAQGSNWLYGLLWKVASLWKTCTLDVPWLFN